MPAAHQRARLPARLRPDRRQGGLRRGGVRRLLGAGRPARARRLRRHRVDRDQLLPGPGRDARRPGGRHLRGARLARGAAPGPARDGGARRLAVRLLHAGVRVQHGRRVLPRRPRGHQRHGAARRRRVRTGTTASTCTRSAATCAAAPATGRSRTPPSRSASPPRTTRWPRRRTTPAPAPAATRLDDGEATFVRPASLADALQVLREDPDAVVVAGSTDWGVEVNLRGVRAAGRGRGRPARRSCAASRSSDGRDPDRRRADADRDRAPARRAGCRSWPR